MTYADEIKLELEEMHKLGMISKSRLARALDYIRHNPKEIEELENNGCCISEAADICTEL